jgi:hypothetical protein
VRLRPEQFAVWQQTAGVCKLLHSQVGRNTFDIQMGINFCSDLESYVLQLPENLPPLKPATLPNRI